MSIAFIQNIFISNNESRDVKSIRLVADFIRILTLFMHKRMYLDMGPLIATTIEGNAFKSG